MLCLITKKYPKDKNKQQTNIFHQAKHSIKNEYDLAPNPLLIPHK
jgi:hypothetical protein